MTAYEWVAAAPHTDMLSKRAGSLVKIMESLHRVMLCAIRCNSDNMCCSSDSICFGWTFCRCSTASTTC